MTTSRLTTGTDATAAPRFSVFEYDAPICDGGGTSYLVQDNNDVTAVHFSDGGHAITRDRALAETWAAKLNGGELRTWADANAVHMPPTAPAVDELATITIPGDANPHPGYLIPSPEETGAHRAATAPVVGTNPMVRIISQFDEIEHVRQSVFRDHYEGLGWRIAGDEEPAVASSPADRADDPAAADLPGDSRDMTAAPVSPAKGRALAALTRDAATKLAASRPDLFELTAVTAEVIRAVLAGEPTDNVGAARTRGYVRYDATEGRRVVTPMGQVAYERHTPAPEPTLAQQQAAGLRALADMIEANPELAPNFSYTLGNSGIYVMPRADDTAAEMAAVARIARRYGAKTDKCVSEKQYNLMADFGAVKFQFLAAREQVCERVVTGTREVTEEVPDPVALAAVPTTTVTKVVEDYEWVCRPLLAGTPEAPVSA